MKKLLLSTVFFSLLTDNAQSLFIKNNTDQKINVIFYIPGRSSWHASDVSASTVGPFLEMVVSLARLAGEQEVAPHRENLPNLRISVETKGQMIWCEHPYRDISQAEELTLTVENQNNTTSCRIN